MKKNILFMSAVAAVAMFASCSNDSLVSDTAPASDPQIKFNTSMKNITRAVTTNENFTSFKVSAFEDGNTTAHFSDKEVLKSGGSWQANENVYWPKSGKALNFFAYSPTSLSPTTTSTGISITSFNLSTSLADQTDILVAYKQQQYDASSADNTVSLIFKHALSNIVIQARNETAGAYEVKVKGVRVGKVKSTADLTFNSTACTWSNHGSTVSNYEIGGREDDTYSEKTVTTQPAQSTDLMNGQAILIIPQDAATTPTWNKTNNDEGSRISICCQINMNSTRIFPASNKQVEYGWISVPLPSNYNWEAGKKYIYTVRFFPNGSGDTGNIDPEDTEAGGGESPSDPIPDIAIDFTATIDEWTSGNGSGETIPSE